MSIRVTITKSNVTDSYGLPMVVGATYTVADDFGLSLISQGKASDTDASLTNPGVREADALGVVYCNAATLAAPTAQMLASYNTVFALDVAPFTKFVSNGTALVPISNGLALSTDNTSAAASANAASIQAALNAGGLVQITQPGTYYVTAPLVVPSKTTIRCGAGVSIIAASGRQAPLLKNKYAGRILPAPLLVRASNVVTVTEVAHTVAVNDTMFISGGSDSSFRGLVTVTAATTTTWTYASTGSNGAAGSTGTYYNVIPVRRTISGTNMVATSNYVTVTDSGHDLRPGMNVWIGKDGGDNFAPGVVQVTKVSASTWTYKTTSATGTASGTFALSYDYDITIDGGSWDGNRLNQGSVASGSEMQNCASMWAVVSNIAINAAIGGTSMRAANFFNCADVTLGNQWRPFDCLVGAQFEAGAYGVLVDQAVEGASQQNAVGTQQSDDYLAFTGTANAAGAGGNYDNTVSPYGLTFFSGLDIRRLMAANALNGIKLTAMAACPFVGTIKIGAVRGRMLDNAPSLGNGIAIRYIDDGPGLVGTTAESIDVVGPLEWLAPSGSNGGGILLNGAGSIGSLRVRDWSGEASLNTYLQMTGTITVKSIDVDASRFSALGTNKPGMNFSAGTVRKLKLRNNRIEVGTAMPFVYLNGASVAQIEFEGNILSGAAAATGDLVEIANSTSFAALKSLSFKGTRTEEGGNAIASILRLGDFAGSTTDIHIDDHDVTSASGITSTGTGLTGTINLYLGSKVKWTATGGNNFLQVGGCTWNVYAQSANNASIPAGRKFLTGFGSPTFKCVGPLSQALTSGAAPAWDLGLGNVATLSTGANATVTLGAPSNVPPAGTPCSITITQDATGGRTVAWNAAYIFPTAFSNTGNTSNKKTTVYFVSDGSALVAQGANSWY